MSSQNGFSGRLGSESEDMDSDRDRTLRALEGFSEQDRLHDKQHHDQGYPQESRGQTDNSIGDLFLDMARDDMNRETSDEGALSTQTEHRRVCYHQFHCVALGFRLDSRLLRCRDVM